MTRIDWYTQQIEVAHAALAEAEGATKLVIRAYLIGLLTEVCEMTGREGQQRIE